MANMNVVDYSLDIDNLEGRFGDVFQKKQFVDRLKQVNPRSVPAVPQTNLQRLHSGVDPDRPDSVVSSYTVNIVGGLPVKTPTDTPHSMSGKASASPSILREKKKQSVSVKSTSVKRGNRRVSCKDLGKTDCEGWLYKYNEHQRLLSKDWVKRWCVLKDGHFYWYKSQDDETAQGLISLQGFHISPVESKEIKVRPKKLHAFKACHSGTTIYFASDRKEDWSKWMNKMGVSAIGYNTDLEHVQIPGFSNVHSLGPLKEHYSESEDSDTGTIVERPESIIRPPEVTSSTGDLTKVANEMQKQSNSLLIRQSFEDASTGDLAKLAKDVEKKHNINMFGQSVRWKRRSQLKTLRNKLDTAQMRLYNKQQKLHGLQKALEDKEKELELIDEILSNPTTEALTDFKKEYLISPHGSDTSLDSASHTSANEDDFNDSNDPDHEDCRDRDGTLTRGTQPP